MEKGCLMTSLMSNDKEICMTVHVKCRHILAVEREHLQLVKSGPLIYYQDPYERCTHLLCSFQPSAHVLLRCLALRKTDTGSGKFSAIFTVPHMKRTCGRLLLLEVK